MRVSILDQSVCGLGHDPAATLRDTVALAVLADRLGYARFWLAEHHSNPGIVGTSPEILAAVVAAATQRIRVGAAGVMLPHYSPFKVAEQWRVIEALAPGRVDLGLGRSPGEPHVAHALASGRAPEQDFSATVRELLRWLGDSDAETWAFPRGFSAPRALAAGVVAAGRCRRRRARPAYRLQLQRQGRRDARRPCRLSALVQAQRLARSAARLSISVGAGGPRCGRRRACFLEPYSLASASVGQGTDRDAAAR